jgi:Zn-dependent protease
MAAGLAIVAVAGPLSNLLLAAASYGVIAGLSVAGVLDAAMLLHGAALPLYVFFSLNLALFMFNLLPLHPLDGGKVLAWLLEWLAPRQARGVDDFLAQYGGIILIILIVALPQVLALYFWPVTWAAAHLLAAVL